MKCPSCGFLYTYEQDGMQVCPVCQHQWNPYLEEEKFILDVNGNKLFSGDSVIVIKDLKVKGAKNPLKQGTKVDNIRIIDGDHNIESRIAGFGQEQVESDCVK